MRSMTGFGRGVAEQAGVRATVDVRAVNHRFLDLKLRGAPLPPAIEDAISTRVRTKLDRGAVSIAVHVERRTAAAAARVDAHAAQRAYEELVQLAATLGVPGPDLALVLAQPGVVVQAEDAAAHDPAVVLAALDGALAQLEAMRLAEGRALAAEVATRLDELAAIRASVAALAATLPQVVSRRLQERLRRLLDGQDAAALEPARLAQEVALLADRADVTEELVRLASHLDQARLLLAGAGAAGRRLDFLVQEIGRELNTIGSKSASTEISAAIVEAKAILEKLREQVQNVE